jgi:hypothetical protein
MVEKICGMCNRQIFLHENQSGLVFEDRFFICEDCCENHSEEEIQEWSKTVMQSPTKGMPITLWLVHEQNKDKPLFTIKK